MKKIFLVSFCLIHILFANTSTRIYDFYQQSAYKDACDVGFIRFDEIKNNEAYISLYAFSCLKADEIDRLSIPMALLNHSAEARANASYFSMLLLQKKLLTQALYDNYPLGKLNLPTSSHILSKVFHWYSKNPQMQTNIKEFTDPLNPRVMYKLYPIERNQRKTIAIDEYYDKILTLHHVY
jgi:hypothetical protein